MASVEGLFTSPREFLKMNLLVMMGAMPTTGGMHGFAFDDGTENELSARRKSKYFWKSEYDITLWQVSWRRDGGGIPAFWLPYRPDSRQRRIVRDDAPFLLTAGMTGCSFGAHHHAGVGLEVNHVNYQTAEDGIDEPRMAAEIAHCRHKLSQKRYREQARGRAVTDVSRQAVMGATIVGVNDLRAGWSLYAQQWENLDGARFVYHELIAL